jgi:hypothetical protein
VIQRILNTVLRRERPEPKIPVCPDHQVEMRLRGKMGRPARFSDQTEQEYTLIYFCPVPGCSNTEMVTRARTQVPVPGEAPERPAFARRQSQ